MRELKAFRIIQGNTGGYGAPSYKCTTDGNRIEEWSDACEVYDRLEADKVIAELEEKCQMHDFFWEGCGFAKRGFKNAIAVSEAFDKLEAEACHHKFKRCLAMAWWCEATALWCYQAANTLTVGFHATLYGKPVMIEHDRLFKRFVLLNKWHNRWLKLAEKFKEVSK